MLITFAEIRNRAALAATHGKLHGLPCNTVAYLGGSADWEVQLMLQICSAKPQIPQAG
ncbi:unnamed protein product (plasmid) [Mycetohabitans rhizoxinica HKI 454]|uniref:Uncharacterized protein n=1 Tax=Mycetohabitans rhizoxinica (strain DSM 19002 / CIP 109453 / HKI 454) TaxID=882378 RepID=E5AW23_MYCRK|nr:unnamed protein product [Mycetohabitans rhizoxinica HKI 454]